jgi:hypothetical protein
VTSVCVVTAAVVMPNVADVAPDATVTLGGTVTVPLALESVTTAPFVPAAAVSVTVPVEGLPPMTALGLAATETSVGAPALGCQPN